MPNETIYRTSFEEVDAQTAAFCRLPAAKPKNYLKITGAKFQKETVTKLSFPIPCAAGRTLPIKPKQNSLLKKGLEHRKLFLKD